MESAKILVVEDETIIAMDIKSRLKSFGYSICLAHSGEGAVKKAEEVKPDIVLMDIMLGEGMDGIQAAEHIRAGFDIPVVYLTAYSSQDMLQRAKITQPFGYLIKPFSERELHVAIEVALYKHQMEKKLKEREQLLSATLRSIGDAVIVTDEKGFVKLINPFAEALTGWKQEEAIDKPLESVFNIISEKTHDRVEDPVKKVTREGIFFGLADDTVLMSKEGMKIPVEIVGTPLVDEKNTLSGAVLVFYDIIERKRLEKQLFNISES